MAKPKQVICLNDLQVYASVTAAAKTYALEPTNVMRVCKELYRHTKGYSFAYYEEGKQYEKMPLLTSEQYDKRGARFKRVVCLNTGEVFENVHEVARFLGVHVRSVYNVLQGITQTCGTVNGERGKWKYEEDFVE